MDRFLHDIESEPQVVADTIKEGAAHIPELAARLADSNVGAIYPIGCGSSYFAGLAGRYVLEEWAMLPTLPVSAKDFEAYTLKSVSPLALVLAISQSGESFETVEAAIAAKQSGLPAIALTNNEESRLARVCDDVVRTRAGVEEGPGSKTVLAQCVSIYQLGLYFANAHKTDRNVTVENALFELDAAPEVVRGMISGKTREKTIELAEILAAEQVIYFIAAGPFYALALQAANSIREIGKVHCFVFEATEFRHGPLEVLSSRSRLIVISNSQCRARDQLSIACQAAKQAGVNLVYVGDSEGRPDVKFDDELTLPTVNEFLAAQLYLAPLQLLAFYIANRKGLDPDHFVNIVKTWVAQ